MSLIPVESLASQLEPAWSFLSGSNRHFVSVADPTPRPGECEYAIVLPVKLKEGDRLVAVGVVIDKEEAEKVARHMFGQPDGPVNQADVEDACLEICNVLASSVINLCENPKVLDIGIPLEVTTQKYDYMQSHAIARVTLASESEDGHRVVVTVFDVRDQSILES